MHGQERVCVPVHLSAEMVPFSHHVGELRAHYAGFFDPGTPLCVCVCVCVCKRERERERQTEHQEPKERERQRDKEHYVPKERGRTGERDHEALKDREREREKEKHVKQDLCVCLRLRASIIRLPLWRACRAPPLHPRPHTQSSCPVSSRVRPHTGVLRGSRFVDWQTRPLHANEENRTTSRAQAHNSPEG